MSLIDVTGMEWLDRHVREALTEDLGDRGDITCAATVPDGLQGRAVLIAKADGIICGQEWAIHTGHRTDPPVDWRFLVEDGAAVHPGQVIAEINGPLTGILISERTALNGLGRLSGIATYAANAVRRAREAGGRAEVIDTRKTTPGWRLAEKYAVRCGGAGNHRIGLFDEILIKENHIAAAGGIAPAMQAVRDWSKISVGEKGKIPVEIEVTSLIELEQAFAELPDRILLDNFLIEELRAAVEKRGSRPVKLEASGGITLDNIAGIAATGIDRISLGALTHSAKPLDLSLLVRQTFPA